MSSGSAGSLRSATNTPVDTTPRQFEGQVEFEARAPTLRGLSAEATLLPARFVVIEAVDAQGQVVATGSTDHLGRFAFTAPGNATHFYAVAQAAAPGIDLTVTRDGLGDRVYRLGVPAAPQMHLRASDTGLEGMAGAFHILDVIYRGMDAAQRWTGKKLPPLFVHWGRGQTSEWSYYRGERPLGSGRFCLELLGGEGRNWSRTDTDEHDEAIVLHELGHFVMDRWSTDSSAGGHHPSGHLLDPGLAWEEGRATWFALAVLGKSEYRDSVGRAPSGALRVSEDFEPRHEGPVGDGSEHTVAEVLWDLTDGADGIIDVDNDGVALGPAAIMQAMVSLGQKPGAFPSLSALLAELVEADVISRGLLKEMLVTAGYPSSMALAHADSWPANITTGGRVIGKIDGHSDPAPSGGPNRPLNGFDAIKTYRVHVPARGRISVVLRIKGSGRARDREDLDVELRTIRAELLDSARTEGAVEVINRHVEPGYYVVYVRDGGTGNAAGYELEVQMQDLPAQVAQTPQPQTPPEPSAR